MSSTLLTKLISSSLLGPNITSSINTTYDDPTKYKHNSPENSFYLSNVTEECVAQLFSNLDERKASLDIPNKLIIKLARHKLSNLFSYVYNRSKTPIFKSHDATYRTCKL